MAAVVIELKSLRAAKRFVAWFEELEDEHDVMRELSEATGVDCTVIDICVENDALDSSADDFLFDADEDDEDEDEIDRELFARQGVRGNDWIL